jgi:hypothetical protein
MHASSTESETTGFSFDAFISYSSADRPFARALQVFLESYRIPSTGRKVRVFLDHTDIRGGELGAEIRAALMASRNLIVCLSGSAAESRWVAKEIQWFASTHGQASVALAVIDDRVDPAASLVGESEYRRHDLRNARRLGMWRPGVRLELLRLLAFITDVELRTLRNWSLRRRIRNGAVALLLALGPPFAIASYPTDEWRPLPTATREQPLYALAAEVSGETLIVASRYRAPGPQGFRNYIRYTTHVSADSVKYEDFSGTSPLRTRLLPLSARQYDVRDRMPAIEQSLLGDRRPTGEPFVAEPDPDRVIVLLPLAPSDEELEEAQDAAMDFGTPIPQTSGALVVVRANGQVRSQVVPDLDLTWNERDDVGPTSPAKAPALAWSASGEIWIGVPGWDAQSDGGLWHSADNGHSWTRLEGFAGVSSIALREESGRVESVIVAESAFDRWRGSSLEPFPTRVREVRDGAASADEVPMPPYGSGSEVEFCGILDGAEIVRVDERLYARHTVTLLHSLLHDAGAAMESGW